MLEISKKSIEEYKQVLIKIISRYKTIRDWRGDLSDAIKQLEYGISWYKPDAQAMSLDITTVWAWRPFWPYEKYKPSREMETEVFALEAGFTKEEYEELKKHMPPDWNGMVPGLPAEPAYDNVVRYIISQIEENYHVKITPKDVLEVITDLHVLYIHPERDTRFWPHHITTLKPGEKWPISPYFIYIEYTMLRSVIKLPNGATIEDLWIEPFKIATVTQNIIIGKMLELVAKRKQLEMEIRTMIGEVAELHEKGEKVFKTIDELVKEEFPEIYLSEEEQKKLEEEKKKLEKKSTSIGLKEAINKIRKAIGDFFSKYLGIKVLWVYPGPYDPVMYHRISKSWQRRVGRMYQELLDFLKAKTGFPSGKIKWVGSKLEE